jgi:hypothetical protein
MPAQPTDEGECMNLRANFVSSIFLPVALTFAIAGLGCERHHYYRIYDPYYTDYHVWNDNETVYYRQWSNETHRDPNRDFRKLSAEEQKEYWTWRHNRGDRDNR